MNEMFCKGYLRQNHQKGIRNKLLILYTVNCASFVAKRIQSALSGSGADVDEMGFDGCFDNEIVMRIFLAFIRHPNVGAVLAVGHGCEYIQAKQLSEYASEHGKPSAWLNIQDSGGTQGSIEKGVQLASAMLEELRQETTIPIYVSDLIFAGECGGSDFTSGLAGNLLVGHFFDKIVDCGGTAIFEEAVECIGLRKLLAHRGATEEAAEALRSLYDKAQAYSKSMGQFSISPGNFAGGLTTIEEKSMGALVKSGSKPIQGVIKIGQGPPRHGLWMMDSIQDPCSIGFGFSNANDSEGIIDLISCGAHIVFLVTGRGHTIGAPVSPVIKITGNAETYRKLRGDIEVDASPIITGKKSTEEMTDWLVEYVRSICNGEKTKGEQLGHAEYYLHYSYQKLHPCRQTEEV